MFTRAPFITFCIMDKSWLSSRRWYSLSFLFLFLLLSRTALTAQTQQAAPPTNLPTLEQAQTLLNTGKIDAAIEMLKDIVKNDSSSWQAAHLLGVAYYQKGDYTQAVEVFAKSLEKSPVESKQFKQAVQLSAMSHYLLGHMKEAIPFLEQVCKWSPDNVEMNYTLGLCYIQTHAADKSREAFARMFAVAPTSASAHLINAQMMIRQQFEEFAEKELQRALELDPKLPQANYLLGELAIYKANLDLGIELLQKEIAINPAFAMAYYRLGDAYTRQLKWDKAVAPLQKSIWLNPYFSAPYIILGKVYLKTDNLPNAEAMLRRALQMDPNNSSAHYILAQTLQQAGRRDEAKTEFELADKLRTSPER